MTCVDLLTIEPLVQLYVCVCFFFPPRVHVPLPGMVVGTLLVGVALGLGLRLGVAIGACEG